MKKFCFISCSILFLVLGCSKSDSTKTLYFEGRIIDIEVFTPLDGVFVEGCIGELSLFPTYPSCDYESYTDSDGYFYLTFDVERLQSGIIRYQKEGYRSLDSCVTLNNGKLECYMKALPTVFYTYSPTKRSHFTYDTAIINVSTATIDTVVNYHTESFPNSFGETSYYWTSDNNSEPDIFDDYTFFNVPDNSEVSIVAEYFIDNNYIITDSQTFFCPKGIGNKYKILD